MALVKVDMNVKIRKDIITVSKQSSEGVINIMFNNGSLTLLGYSNSSFCLCKEYIECDLSYCFRVDAGLLVTMSNCATMEFNIDRKSVTIDSLDDNGVSLRQAQIKLNTDTTVNYQLEYYMDLIGKLRSGYPCKSLSVLKKFDKISRINNKTERGVVISNKQFYTDGDGFKFFGTTEIDFNCFLLSDDLKNIIEFVGDNDNIMYEQNGFIVCKNVNDCYFGVRTANPPQLNESINKILEQKPEMIFDLSISELKSHVRPLKVNNVSGGRITLLPNLDTVVVATSSIVFKLPMKYNNLKVDVQSTIELDFKLFNKLIQSLEATEQVRFLVFSRFIAMVYDKETFLLVSRC